MSVSTYPLGGFWIHSLVGEAPGPPTYAFRIPVSGFQVYGACSL
jgi:hypothetical protein